MSWSRTTALPADLLSASLAREFVREHLDQHGLMGLVDDIELVVSELATNAVVHARTPFEVTLEAVETSVRLTVSDGSMVAPRPELRGQVPQDLVPAQLFEGGRGLVIVQMLSLDWGVRVDEGQGKAVWASFETRTLSEGQHDRSASRPDAPPSGREDVLTRGGGRLAARPCLPDATARDPEVAEGSQSPDVDARVQVRQ